MLHRKGIGEERGCGSGEGRMKEKVKMRMKEGG